MLPKSLGQQEREDAERAAIELEEIIDDATDLSDQVDKMFHKFGAVVNGLKLEPIKDHLDEWLSVNEELLASLRRNARGLPS